MTITECIKALEAIKDRFGDIEVLTYDWYETNEGISLVMAPKRAVVATAINRIDDECVRFCTRVGAEVDHTFVYNDDETSHRPGDFMAVVI